VTSRVLTPQQALERVREVLSNDDYRNFMSVIGIAGPGDPLANEATFETFRLVKKEFPHLISCLSTNGLLLPDRFDDLLKLGLKSLTITINAIDPEVGAKIYSNIHYHGKVLNGPAGAKVLIDNQFKGLALATSHDIVTKINTVLIPGINDDQVQRIALAVKERGAFVMNIMPVIPQADFADIVPPTAARLQQVRDANEDIMVQFRHCSQCRSDAIGLICKKQEGIEAEATCNG
jgi:nitrogen fixation protein NifB